MQMIELFTVTSSLQKHVSRKSYAWPDYTLLPTLLRS